MRTGITSRAGAVSALCLALLAPSIGYGPPGHAATVQAAFFVDGSHGSDSNPGTAAMPFKTIQQAQTAVRAIDSDMTGDIDVEIAPGDYYEPQTLTFGTADSGTNGHNVVYESTGAPGTVRLIGGKTVTGWQSTTSTDTADDLPAAAVGKVFKTQLPAGTDFNTLYVNDKRAVKARTKNYTFDPRFPASSGTSYNQYLLTTGGDEYSITYGSDLDDASIKGMTDAKAKGQLAGQFVIWSGIGTAGSDWFQDTLPIGDVDTAGRRLTTIKDPDHPEVNRTHWTFGEGSRYFVQDNLAFLDSPGEYFLNKTTGWLYYYPSASEVDPGTGRINVPVVAPTVQKVISFKGADKPNLAAVPDPAKQVHNIVLNGLTVKDTDFTDSYVFGWNAYDAYGLNFYPPEAAGSTNPSYSEVTDRIPYHVGAITLTDTNHITIENTRITDVGMNAVEFFRDNDSETITNCAMDNIGMSGIDTDGGYPGIGKYSGNHTVTNVLIHDVGQFVGSAPGITLMSTGHSRFSHLEIYNSPRRAILLNAGWLRNETYDGGYNPLTDMYTVENHFSDVYVHDSEQDSGEDSPIFGWVLLDKDLVYQHTNPPSYDPGPGHYNYFDQMVIDNIGANPSMHDKNTVLGMDFAPRATGLVFSNIKSTNVQSYNMDAHSWWTSTNLNYNFFDGNPDNTGVNTFDDSKMDYANIGLTSAFPAQFAVTRQTVTPPSDVYFSEDFEGSGIDTTNKWIAERGTPAQSTVYMAEGPFHGKKALAIDTDANPNGEVLSRKFASNLNKIVTMKFMDRRIDLATSDNDAKHLPNTWARVDDGITQEAIGADGNTSTDYYVVKNGTTTTLTNVPRAFGWHELKWDYTSGTTVKMYIDGVLVATKPATSFNYISMGDPTGAGCVTYFDDLYVYGGAAAPPPGNVVQPVHIDGALTATNYANISGMTVATAPAPENAKYASVDKVGSYLDYFVNVGKTGVYQVTYRAAVKSGGTGGVNLLVDGTSAKTTSLPSTGGLSKWANVTDSVPLTAGLHTIRLRATTKGWNFESAKLAYAGQGVPGTIQGVSYDAKSGDIQTVSGSEGPAVGYLGTGNSMDYKVDVASSGTYTLAYRVAVNKAGAVQFLVDGVAQKTTSLPASGGWDTWETVTDTVSLTAGPHTIRILVAQDGWNFKSFQLSKPGNQAPGTIEGASYDVASAGVQTIPVTDSGSTQGVGFLQNGSTLDYKVNIIQAKTYTLSYRVAVNKGKSGAVTFQVDGASLKTTALPTTGDWQNWETVTDTVTLPAGQHTIRLLVTKNNWNLHWFSLA